ncbi:hypothetical protein [Cohnella cholangitidis]|uniref:Uncharacterized protein n=1 Tax=Cohnella cholangitidis TaxID=2598458 RepID=A0A7G5BXK5_9BACL|nr:hypothetical protein [Cohnella cholangitidis]QMV41689.1 hypothetical protein FPL14_11215 [Cohnella cholangitidis]
MFPELLWIVGFYAAAVALVHWVIRRGSALDRHHYVLVAGNHQMQIEWYIRALQQFSRRTGTEIGITVVLDQSTDDTGKIMERFARGGNGIEWVRSEGGQLDNRRASDQKVVWVELARKDDVDRLPL